MQWADESGGPYGEDPYGGVGHAYAYGYEYGGSSTTDTVTTSWDPVVPAQWTYPGDATPTPGADPHAIGTHLHAAGPDPATTAWDSPHGDVLTVPLPESGTAGDPVPEPDAQAGESVRPVFVDPSGRRRRRVLRAARLLVIPAGGYVALLIGTMLGGPGISAPFVPQPDPTHPTTPPATAPDASSGTGHSGERASSTATRKNPGPAAQQTPGSTAASAASTAPAATSAPTAAPPRTTSPASTVPAATSKGRALGSSHRPVK